MEFTHLDQKYQKFTSQPGHFVDMTEHVVDTTKNTLSTYLEGRCSKTMTVSKP